MMVMIVQLIVVLLMAPVSFVNTLEARVAPGSRKVWALEGFWESLWVLSLLLE